MLRFAEEIVLLLLSDDDGRFARVPSWSLEYALAGAVLMDLALEGRIDTDLDKLVLVDATPVGDSLLDPTLAEIAEGAERDTRFWVEHVANRAYAVRDESLSRLIAHGILESRDDRFLWVFQSRRYPTVDGQVAFEEQIALLESRDPNDERFQGIRSHADALIVNIDGIKGDRAELFRIGERSQALRTELANLRSRLDGVVIPAIDDQLFYTMTGYRNLVDPPAPTSEHLSEEELGRYRRLAELQADANIATQLMASAFTLSRAASIEPLRERFEAVDSRIKRNLSGFEDSPLHAELDPIFAQLSAFGLDEDSGFNLVELELTLAEHQQNLLAQNSDIALDLVGEVNGLVSAADASTLAATQASMRAILAGRTLPLVISGITIGAALLIAWLYVGRVLLNRLQRLSDRMRRMAGGDLEGEVEITGRDEVADMAAALEVFRRHALEVQRLNLVEQLAGELQDKNDQLESVLADLQRAQDQIVMREKLAALGELTAGVAHEIRNPLNFVKNFSEGSVELIDELREVMEEGTDTLTAEQRQLIEDVLTDLSDNLTRIRSHGDRADRIVHDMLMMGRGSGELQATDINRLIDEHARLAYHSARATDPNFQLDLQQDFDLNVGELDVVPQDLGRVFLNMVSNACYATNQKRRAAIEAGDEASYSPTLLLSTRHDDDQIEIRVRDNGSGILPTSSIKSSTPSQSPLTRAPVSVSRSRMTSYASTAAAYGSKPSRASSPR